MKNKTKYLLKLDVMSENGSIETKHVRWITDDLSKFLEEYTRTRRVVGHEILESKPVGDKSLLLG